MTTIARSEFNKNQSFSIIRAEFSEAVNESLRIENEITELNRQKQKQNMRLVELNERLKDLETE